MSTILFSGRFDKPHAGHIITIQRLGIRYDKVIVCVLDYPEARYSLSVRISVLTEALAGTKGNYLVIANKTHFGEITVRELEELPYFDYYGTGNVEVFEKIKAILPPSMVVFVPRYPGYAASTEEV